MTRKSVFAAVFVPFGVALAVASADDKEKPEYTIKQVMKVAHKDGLMKKVAAGEGSKEDAEKLVKLYEALEENKPPKGDEESWKKQTKAMIDAAEDAVKGEKGAGDALKKAANCAECHKAHKPG